MTKSWSDLEDVKQADYSDFNNLLVIDGNNVSYRYIQRANYDSYEDDFKRTVASLAKSYKAKRTIVCFDFGKSYYRMNLLGDYKGTRKKAETEEEIEHAEKFFAVLNRLPEELDEEVLKFRGIEADDTIAYITQNISERYDHTWIVSSDKDIIQLVDDNISIFNIFSRKEITKQYLQDELALTPSEFMLSRIIEGDKGDNIIGIEGIGPKRAQALAKEYKTLDKLLSALPIKSKSQYITNLNAGRERLIRNETLINLKRYHQTAINAGKEGDDPMEILSEL
jgi:5'-3' exonuclease